MHSEHIDLKAISDSWVSVHSLLINNSEGTPLPTCRWCHEAMSQQSHCFVIRKSRPGSKWLVWNKYSHRTLWWQLENVYVHTRVCSRRLCSRFFTRLLSVGFLCYCFIVCIKVFVRNMFVSEDELYFYHSNDLTQLELGLMCLAFFRLWLRVCVFFFFCQGGEHRWLEPAVTPVGLKFACFPPICSTQPNQR